MSAYTPTIAEIQQWANDIIDESSTSGQIGCPHCKADPSYTKKHGTRPRQYILIIDKCSTAIHSQIARCRCTHCKKSFTVYPPFALPYKRYTSATIIEAMDGYVEAEPRSNESTAAAMSTRYCETDQYGNADPETIVKSGRDKTDEKSLSGSSIFRWVLFLGSLVVTQEKATDLIVMSDPNSTVFRETFPIASRKYRSKEKCTLLKRCLKTIFVNTEFQRIFKRSLFPDFAITCGYG